MTNKYINSVLLVASTLVASPLASTAFQLQPRSVHLQLGSLVTRHNTQRTATTRINLFGNLFGENAKNFDDQQDLQENELARFSNLSSGAENINVKFDSLSIMISEWSRLFVDDEGDERKKMGLTTPVMVVPLEKRSIEDEAGASKFSGVQLLFKKPKIGGRSAYDDKDSQDDDSSEKQDKDGEGTIKEGGVEVQVQKLSNGELQVTAKRCEVEEGTLIKEMSEQTILDSLRAAVGAWRKEQMS